MKHNIYIFTKLFLYAKHLRRSRLRWKKIFLFCKVCSGKVHICGSNSALRRPPDGFILHFGSDNFVLYWKDVSSCLRGYLSAVVWKYFLKINSALINFRNNAKVLCSRIFCFSLTVYCGFCFSWSSYQSYHALSWLARQ